MNNPKLSSSFFYFSLFILVLIIFKNSNSFLPQARASDSPVAGLVNVETLDPSIQVKMAYSTNLNFAEKKISGYVKNICYLKEGAAQAIVRINDVLKKQSPAYRIVLRDCWRPHRATLDMLRWAKEIDDKRLSYDDLSDFQKNTFQDPQLFEKGILKTQNLLSFGYLSPLSNHSRGSTVDLELQFYEESFSDWKDLNMGTQFDTFSQSSAHFADMGNTINLRRSQLKQLMNQYGFSSLAKEWWHWTHRTSNESPILDGEVH